MLEYENQIFLDAFHDDGLLITASLVLVLNTTSYEEEYFIEHLTKDGEKPLPKVITSEYNVNDRFVVRTVTSSTTIF
ncbi:hypothetical protein LSAT2_031626 [Lamellibrachia satsuma]|nr:hypothetical protein LSAT2_031626 [Lamellibrachia satsuma]